jgi:hypothetical protein
MSSQFERRPPAGRPAVYEIRLEGRLGTEWSEWFAGLQVSLEDGDDTILSGPLDQSGLHGVLRRARDLGLPLVSVARIEPDSDLFARPTAPNPSPDPEEATNQ